MEVGNANYINCNFQIVMCKLRAVVNTWYFRMMTIIGKITVVNSLMASLFVYKMQVLPLIDDKIANEFETIVKEFIWTGAREKIPFTTLTANKESGGFGLVDIKKKHRALLFNWVSDCKNSEKVRSLVSAFLGDSVNDESIWKFNLIKRVKEFSKAIHFGTN